MKLMMMRLKVVIRNGSDDDYKYNKDRYDEDRSKKVKQQNRFNVAKFITPFK